MVKLGPTGFLESVKEVAGRLSGNSPNLDKPPEEEVTSCCYAGVDCPHAEDLEPSMWIAISYEHPASRVPIARPSFRSMIGVYFG